MGKRTVAFSEDLKRVCELSRRVATRERAAADAAMLTPLLQTPKGKAAGAHLLPWQGFGLREFYENQGAYLQLPVGNGKTLISKEAGYVADAERPVLVVPSSLYDKTNHEFAEYNEHWRSDAPVKIVKTHELTQEPNVDYLGTRLCADLYIIDECDVLMNPEGSATVRLDRDICARNVPVLCMTGTGTRNEIENFSHFIIWALGDKAPLPRDPDELEAWGLALNAKTGRKKPYGVGALVDLIELTPAEILDALPKGEARLTAQAEARLKFRKRLCETPGVVIVDDEQCLQPLTIRKHYAPSDKALDVHFNTLRRAQKAPNGLSCEDPLAYYQTDMQVGCGLTLELTPRPPVEWYEAHREYAQFCRQKIRRSRHTTRPLDTELAVRKRYPDEKCVRDWLRIKDAHPYESVPRWLSGSVIEWAARWVKEHRGLVWCEHNAFGEMLSEVTGLHYYGAGGVNRHGAAIERADVTQGAILSVRANLRGRNLQGWNHNLVIGWPQSARYAEQLLGRTHRYGQKRPVFVDVLLLSGMTEYAFRACMREAQFVLFTQGQRQKLLRADIREPISKAPATLRWSEKKDD